MRSDAHSGMRRVRCFRHQESELANVDAADTSKSSRPNWEYWYIASLNCNSAPSITHSVKTIAAAYHACWLQRQQLDQ